MKSDKELAKNEIKRLIALYDDLVKTGQYDKFNEDETCRKLILPLFKALGWDTDAKIIADEVTGQHDAGGQKRVDYSFNINSQPVLFLEAKQLSVDLYNPNYANQAINYGYSKTVKWVILSDFEGIKVFNSLVKTRRLSEKTIIDLKHTDYLEKFDILWLLSKESIVDGKLNEYAKTFGHVDNKIPINELLLSRLLKWRDILITQIASDNPKLSKDEVSECVQKLINRLIFIRTCEDRKIEEPFLLKNIQNEWENDSSKYLHKMLAEVFKEFDREYDSSLFEKHEIDNVKVRDNILDDIIGGIYEDLDEDVSFDFSAIDSDVLGSIYEQYLGTIQNEESKGIRKSQGIYYTPKYIVDYIVESTLGKIIEEKLSQKKYEEIGKLRVLDPACGSGSFLLKVLELFDSAYAKSPEYAKYPLTRKIRALGKNIYGVDLDTEAVELTRLNLLLSSINRNKKLPNLSHNIECGNSLIEDPKIAGDKAFDWNKRFKFVMEDGGFDVIIGNPPYVVLGSEDPFLNYYKERYVVSHGGKINLYKLFIEKAFTLLKEGGYLGFICPSNYLSSADSYELRKLLLENTKLIEIIEYSEKDKVFEGVTQALTTIVFQKKIVSRNCFNLSTSKSGKNIVDQEDFKQNKGLELIVSNPTVSKMNKQTKRFKDVIEGYQGEINVSVHKDHFIKSAKNGYLPLLRGNLIARYELLEEISEYCPVSIDKRGHYLEERIAFQEVSNQQQARRIKATIVDRNILCGHTTNYCFPKGKKINLHFLLALLNSTLINYYFKYFNKTNHVPIGEIKNIPFPEIKATQQRQLAEKAILIERIYANYSKVKNRPTSETERLKRQIEETSKDIDDTVYKLYELTDEEIKVVEGEAKSK